MATTGLTRTPRIRVRRGVTVVGLVAVSVIALVVAPASTASAGRYSSAVKVHNATAHATLVVAESRTDNSRTVPHWEAQGTPVNGRVVKPGHQAHYELVTKEHYIITGHVDYVVHDAAGHDVGKVFVSTSVDGTASWPNYGKATNRCSTRGPFTCEANGTDSVTVRDMHFFEIANRTSKLTFVLQKLPATTTFVAHGPEVGTRLGHGAVLRNSLNAHAGKVTGAQFFWSAYDAKGHLNGSVVVNVNVGPDGRITSHCGSRTGSFKCWDDGKGHAYFLDLSVPTPLHETH